MEQQNHPQVEIINARIAATQLGFDGAAMFGTLQLQAKGFGVSFSGHILHVEAQTEEQEDWQTGFGMEYIASVLRTVGVQSWEDLQGQAVRLRREGNQVVAIGHLIEEVWFNPSLKGEHHQRKAKFQAEALEFYRQKLADDVAEMVDAPKAQEGDRSHVEPLPADEVILPWDKPTQAE